MTGQFNETYPVDIIFKFKEKKIKTKKKEIKIEKNFKQYIMNLQSHMNALNHFIIWIQWYSES